MTKLGDYVTPKLRYLISISNISLKSGGKENYEIQKRTYNKYKFSNPAKYRDGVTLN